MIMSTAGISSGFHRVGANADAARARERLVSIMVGISAGYEPPPVQMPATGRQMPAMADTLTSSEVTRLTPSLARQQGYTGNTCQSCNSSRMKVSGHCEVCEECGSSSGCS